MYSTANSCRPRASACSSSIDEEQASVVVTQFDIAASWVLPGLHGAAIADRSIAIRGDEIASLVPGVGDGILVMPALANAHDHARVARLSQVGSYDVPLEAWLPYLTLIPAVDPYLASAVAFGRSARGGVGSVMAHYTRVQGLTDYPTEAKAVAKAARDVGVRMALAVHCRDLNPLVYDPHEKLLAELSPSACDCVTRRFLRNPAPAAEQAAMVEAVAADIEKDGVTVQYGPAGVQWCTDTMLRLIGEASARANRRVHMHLLETKYQRNWADRTFPNGIVNYLDEIGLLNERVSFAHCIYLRPEEMELIAARGATIVVNTSSNFIVSSGLAPVAEFLRRGCRVAMGLDGLSFDEDEDALREMRLAYAVHKASGFDIRVSREDLFRFATANGRFAITGDARAEVAPGAPADLLLVDWKALSAELIESEVPPIELLLAKGRQQYIKGLVVAGREVMRDGALTGIDLPALEAELLAALRKAFPTTADVCAAMPALKAALRKHYTGPLYCA
jgi:5-methylthioadenosine/S-adenosylhomocysteine deaminase